VTKLTEHKSVRMASGLEGLIVPLIDGIWIS
jgi:hypothetical protein